MYINQHDLVGLSSLLIQDKHLVIEDFLTKEFSKRIGLCLEKEVDWGVACRIDKISKTFLQANDFTDLDLEVQAKFKSQSHEEFQFLYNTYMMVTAYLDKRDPSHFLNRVLEWLNTKETLDFFRRLTQQKNIVKTTAQATRYLPGHFLTQHNDENIEEGRLYAYVLGLSKDWNPDWGGILNILDDKGNIVKSIAPKYNSLSLFKVPQNHFVSYVTPFAKRERLSITGWLLDH